MGKRAVDYIIHGISDRTMKSSASRLALRCSQFDQLLQFLMSNKENQISDRSFGKNNSNQSNYKTIQNNQSQNALFCFNCEERGYPNLKCPKPLIKCNKCNKIGHKGDDCSQDPKFNNRIDKTGAPSKTMCITSFSPNSKFIKLVTVNGRTVEAFIDFGSEVTLIRKSTVSSLNQVHDQISSVMKGFGNKVVQSLICCSV